MIALSLRQRIKIDLNGLGNCQLMERVPISSASQCFITVGKGVWRYFGGGMEPFPTSFRDVSGRNSAMLSRQTPDAMHKNQNIQGHPAANVKAPPRIGPKLGAIVILKLISLCLYLATTWDHDGTLTRMRPMQRTTPFRREMQHP